MVNAIQAATLLKLMLMHKEVLECGINIKICGCSKIDTA